MKNIFQEERAQISVELIIVLAAVVAVVLVLVSQMQSTSQEGTKKLKETSDSVLKKIDDIK
jgi:competence protein ComGC